MTRSRNTPASRSDSPLLSVDSEPAVRLTADDLDETSRQAWTEAMTVRPFGDAYLVDCAERTHYVTLDPSSCSCHGSGDEDGDDTCDDPGDETGDDTESDDTASDNTAGDDTACAETTTEDTAGDDSGQSAIEEYFENGSEGTTESGSENPIESGSENPIEDGNETPIEDGSEERCEHVRRVAIEINLGRVPPPAEHSVECGGCDRQVAVSAANAPPYLCADCDLEPGDVVIDTAGDVETPLLVVSEPGRPADLVAIPDESRTVSEYPGNDEYASDTPVVEAVYPHAISTDRQPRRYLFPLTRLGKPDPSERRPPELESESGSAPEP